MSRQVPKVTLLTQLDRVEGVIKKIRRRASRGYFTNKTLFPLLTELRRDVENSSLPPEALAIYHKMRKKVEIILRESPIVIEDFKYTLYGIREYYGNVKIKNPKSIMEFVILRRREILGITTEEDIPDDPELIV